MKATETTVLNFIGGLDKTFIIPPFQRNYEWTIEQCTELFYDIIEAHKTGKSHYLGNVVYYQGKNSGASYSEIILIDGQQRVTTILILLCALRDVFSDTNKSASINRRYLFNDTDDNRYRIRLKQTAYDSASFMAILDRRPLDNDENNVYKNYILFKELIKDCDVNALQLYETVPKLEIVEVNLQVQDELKTVQTIFEKINSTGKPLTAADLIRNLLLLSDSSIKQNSLYNDYWLRIENILKNENVSRFARDYLIMKTFEDVQEKLIYKKFKCYVYDLKTDNESILLDMYKHAKFYSWLRFENCPDVQINRHIQMSNVLKTEDVYPLYLYILFSAYDSDIIETRKVFNLITDFLLRYRVVSPGGGGGSLRSVIRELLENLSSGALMLNHESLLYELSNSANPSGRFPDNEEFKNQICSTTNNAYARILLLKIEEFETQNIPVDIKKVTIEHLMPQTLTYWWKENLGGDEKAKETFEEYINCIGNLTLISQSYNSKISNNPWSDKLNELKKVQFQITSSIAEKYPSWKKENIQDRNRDISNRACNAITTPLSRTRPYRTREKTSEYEAGSYSLANLEISMSGASLVSLQREIENHRLGIPLSAWKNLLPEISNILYNENSEKFNEIVSKNLIHKATSKSNYPDKDPIITKNMDLLVTPILIGETQFYCEGQLSSDRARVYSKQLLDYYGLTSEFTIEIQ